MISSTFMGSWVPVFRQTIDTELNLLDHEPPFTSFQLATISPSGFPLNRTMVFRGFLFNDNATNVLTATTDSRSEKYAELCLNDKFEAVFWFERLKKQFRLRGHARIIDHSHQPMLDLTKIQPQRLLEDLMLLKQDVHDDIDEECDDKVLADSHNQSIGEHHAIQSNGNIPTVKTDLDPIHVPTNSSLLSTHNLNHMPAARDSLRDLDESRLNGDSTQMLNNSLRNSTSANSAQRAPQRKLFAQSQDVSEDGDEDNDDGLEMCVSGHSDPASQTHRDDDAQKVPLSSTLCSPSLFHKISQSSKDLSFTNLHDLSQFLYYPPTPEEWKAEITRQWTAMTKKMKKSFRKPPPSEPMTGKHCKTIDSIARGVDGKKDEAGLANFAVIALFVDYVDMVELDKDKRIIFRKDANHQWSESEVCP